MNLLKSQIILLLVLFIVSCTPTETPKSKLRVLILEGQNNHYVWPKTSRMIQSYLEETGLFEVEISRDDTVWLGIKYNPNRPEGLTKFITDFPMDTTMYRILPDPAKTSDFSIDFSQYDLVVSNLGANTPTWPEATRRNFEQYMTNGGGLVVFHAANNAWGDWPEYNRMIGLGAWGERDSTTGPYVYYDVAGQIKKDSSAGTCGSHGLENETLITSRAPEHPIMKGLPPQWLHTKDELYDRMRGPFENATILATAYSDVEKNQQPWEPSLKGTGWHVPTLLAIEYGKGRVFHTPLGHFDYSVECVGFKTVIQRGAEWAATGKVTQSIPETFPTDTTTASIKWIPSAIK